MGGESIEKGVHQVKTILRMRNSLMVYPWGSQKAIPDLLGISNPEQKPIAEMWMGTHPKGPSKILREGAWEPLEQVICSFPEMTLGAGAARQYNNQLPFLFKVLAAEKPLSIQVHPDRKHAEEGYQRENEKGLPQDALERNYRDPHHKPEIICALDDFDALKGFRSIDEIIVLLQKIAFNRLDTFIDMLSREPAEEALKRFFRSLMTLKKQEMAELTAGVAERAAERTEDDVAFRWTVALEKAYPGDPGVLAPLILNLIRLRPGQALFLPAGEIHAYLRGVGVELMANSDNVIRAGLTSKHVDVSELLSTARFKTGSPGIVKTFVDSRGREIYETPAEEFLLSRIRVEPHRPHQSGSRYGPEMLLCTDGVGEIENSRGHQRIRYTGGMSFFIPAAVHDYSISGCGTFFCATVPPLTTS
jgi:mannose-6-phosphate isomerase